MFNEHTHYDIQEIIDFLLDRTPGQRETARDYFVTAKSNELMLRLLGTRDIRLGTARYYQADQFLLRIKQEKHHFDTFRFAAFEQWILLMMENGRDPMFVIKI